MPSVTPAASTALSDFDFMAALVRDAYAGYPRAVQGREAELAAWTGLRRREIAAGDDGALARWLHFFRDGHLRVARTDGGTEEGAEPPAPSLRFPAGGPAQLRVPSFDLRRRDDIAALVASEDRRLFRTPALLLDLRGNRGGGDASFFPLLPLVHSGPMRQAGVEVRATPHSVAHFRALGENAEVPADMRPLLAALAARLEASLGGFVAIARHRAVDPGKVHPFPARVAILIDHRVASSAEEFLLLARQSAKVVLVGATPTEGVLDHANVATFALPSGVRALDLPTSRTTRPPEAAVDGRGIAPDVLLDPGDDPVAAALALLQGDAWRGMAAPSPVLSPAAINQPQELPMTDKNEQVRAAIEDGELSVDELEQAAGGIEGMRDGSESNPLCANPSNCTSPS